MKIELSFFGGRYTVLSRGHCPIHFTNNIAVPPHYCTITTELHNRKAYVPRGSQISSRLPYSINNNNNNDDNKLYNIATVQPQQLGGALTAMQVSNHTSAGFKSTVAHAEV